LLHVETGTKKRDISAELTEFEILLDVCGKATAYTSSGVRPIGYKIRFSLSLKMLVLLIVLSLYQMNKKHI
jgi:hypothetical protein